MNKRDEEACKHFLKAYKHQWDLNQTARDSYDNDLEYYTGYRNESDYPLAYNMTFPQLLPRIMTMLSRMLEQIYQGGSADLVGVRPRKRADVERAPRVQGLLNYQLETLNDIDVAGSSYIFNYQWMLNALSWGTGIAKVYWKKEERISPKRIQFPVPKMDQMGRLVGMEWRSITQQAPQIVYDAPYAEVIHNKLFVPHPHYKNIQQMPNVFCVYRRSMDYLHEMQKKGVYKNVKELGWSSKAGVSSGTQWAEDSMEAFSKSLEIENYIDIAQLESDRTAPMVDVVEGYGKYIFPEDETAYEVGSGVKIKGKESEAIVHIGNYKTLLKIQKNTYGKKPFFNIGAYRHPEIFWDMGIIRLGKSIQEQYDTLANTRYQGALMQTNPMLLVEQDADIPVESMIWKPFGFIPGGLEQGVPQIQTLTIPDNYGATFREQEEFFKSTIEDMTGMYRYNMGATPVRQENVGTIHSLQAMGESRIKLLLMTMDYQGFQPLLKYMMLLNTWHLPDNFEARINGGGNGQGPQFSPLFAGDIHPDYDFTARYTAMEPSLGRHYKAQQLLQFSQIWSQSPYLQQYEWMKSVMELFDFSDTDKYLKSPEMVQKEQQQMLQQQMQMEAMKMQGEDKLAAAQSKRDLERDVTKALLK